jgi:putative phosphoribosyl transferase
MKQTLRLNVDNVTLPGELVIPENASGLIIFSHGSGSSRFSPRNNFVAQHFQRLGLATFLFDLLSKEEDKDFSQRFNIDLISQRLIDATNSLLELESVKILPVGYFGASTGAASALIAASILQNKIKAVVSRGGRPDLAMSSLPKVKAPTLLIVGELDLQVLTLNREALQRISGIKSLNIIKGATHIFEEFGTLDQVAQLSGEWFLKHLTPIKEDILN